jgi:hypothetical protein
LLLPPSDNTSPTPSVISLDTSAQKNFPRITLKPPGLVPLDPNPLEEYFTQHQQTEPESLGAWNEDYIETSDGKYTGRDERRKRKAAHDTDNETTSATSVDDPSGTYRQFSVNGRKYKVSNGRGVPSTSLHNIAASMQQHANTNHPINGSDTPEALNSTITEIDFNEIPGLFGRVWLAISFLAKGHTPTPAFYGEADLGHASVMDLLHFVVSKDNYATNRQTARYKLAIVCAVVIVAMLIISFIYITVMPRWKVYSCGETVPPNQCGLLENWHDMVVFCTPSLSLLQFDIINRDNKKVREGINLGPAKNCKLEYYSELTVVASKTSRHEFDNREIHLSEELSLCLQQLLAAKRILTLPHSDIVVEYGCTSIGKYELPVAGVIDRVVSIINYILP